MLYKTCIQDGCKTHPTFNIEGQTKALYCSTHKKEGMINVISKTCIHDGCKVIPIFNIEGQTKALYCSTHKKEGMINVISKTCIHDGCKVIPTYNIEGSKKALYCVTHKNEEMVDIKHKTCIHDGCKVIPNYNIECSKKALYCVTHKKEGMVDIKNKTCIHDGCKTHRTFNIEGQTTALYCSTHKKEGMINVIYKTCLHDGCKVRPTYNIEGSKKALYCVTHKKEVMINVISKTCNSSWCYTRVQEKYDGYCLYCYMHLFPDKPVSRNYKTKEYAVVEYVKNKFPYLDWIADKIINGGCSKRRPDLILDLGYQIIIIEIDENQHIDYDCSCENKRIMQLSQDLNHRPIIFIRFNPDDYKDNDKNISTCWGQNKQGICVVKPKKKEEWDNRLNKLESQIQYWINPVNITNKTIEVIQLFYDI
jgi:hypothetical protein